MGQLTRETEVFVMGGGPAGLAAALAARRVGLEVAVADCSRPPIDKGCGEGIMPDGLSALEELGVRLDRSQGTPFKGIHFIHGDQQVGATFKHGTGLGLRRTYLHQALVDAATRAGVRLLWNSRVTATANGLVTVNGETIHCRWIVGADGQNSQARKLADLDSTGKVKVRIGLRQHYRVTPWSEFVEVHWSDFGQMYVTPIGNDAVCVAFISGKRVSRFEDALRHFPKLAGQLQNAVPEDLARGAVTATRDLKKIHRGCFALIGDAAGSVDAVTGEGLAIGFRQATVLATALASDNVAGYEAAVKRIMRVPRAMATLMLSMDGHPAFRRRAFAALEATPGIFEHMLAIHTGAIRPSAFGLRNGLSLGWNLLAAKGELG
jgi:flavin-dependent dehydrogenase